MLAHAIFPAVHFLKTKSGDQLSQLIVGRLPTKEILLKYEAIIPLKVTSMKPKTYYR